MGPTCKVSFKDMPVDDFAEASNTTLNFVVVLDYWRASEASETLSGVTNGNRRYIYIYIYIWYVQDTLVARARCYVMWEELSVSHF